MTVKIIETRDIPTCHALRRVVFIDEQGVSPEDEVDGCDDEAIHLLAIADGAPVGTARILLGSDYGKIGRVCVLTEARGEGIGAGLIRAAVERLRAMPGIVEARLGAQTHALGFYERLGFVSFGIDYLDAGIPHRDMRLRLHPK
jgi:ElaA protein